MRGKLKYQNDEDCRNLFKEDISPNNRVKLKLKGSNFSCESNFEGDRVGFIGKLKSSNNIEGIKIDNKIIANTLGDSFLKTKLDISKFVTNSYISSSLAFIRNDNSLTHNISFKKLFDDNFKIKFNHKF